MATPTYDLLASTTLTSSASSVTFNSIDQSYGDLILVAATDSTGGLGIMTFNSDTGSNYHRVIMRGTGSSAQSSSETRNNIVVNSSDFSVSIFQIMDYSATDKHKAVLSRDNRADDQVVATASRWANTSGITSISIPASSGNFVAGSTFNLYGVAK